VQLTPSDHRAVEHVEHGAAQRLGAVEHHQDRSGDVQAALAQPDDQLGDQRGVLGRALDQRQWVLRPVDADAQGHHAAVLAEVHPVDHQPHQVQLRQVLGQQLGQRGLGGGDEPARDRRTRRAHCGLLGALTNRLQAHRVAPGRQPGQHALHRHAPEHFGAREQLIGGHRQLPGAIGGAHPRPAHRHPTPTQAHRSGPVPVAGRGAFGVVASLGPARRGHVGLHHRGQHLQPGAHGQGQQPFLHLAGQLG
jgi:hypothetical protein